MPDPEETAPAGVSFAGVVPGLIAIVGLEAAYWLAPATRGPLLDGWLAWMVALVALPFSYLLLACRPPAALGYRRDRALAWYLRGAAAGSLWRLFSMTTNFWGWWDGLAALAAVPALWAGLAWKLILVPLVEETFFRGYLQAGLEAGLARAGRAGPLVALLVQALLFALHPGHAAQGWRAFPSILFFGLLAGALYARTRSIWIVYGAHGIANLLPDVVLWLARSGVGRALLN